ncbi:pilus (MSHA type) biogenesis protein MshL [Thermosulfidibacter takaii]|nr:pilus (MSHA type) biogenesis protein MshL [Thermosulfidibacter takaii]
MPEVKSNKMPLSVLVKPVLKADLATLQEERKRKRFDLVLRDAPLGEVLRTLAREKGYNIVFGSGVPVHDTVTVDLRQITFDEALKVLSKSKGFAYVIDGNTVWIVKSQIDTRIFKMDVVNLTRAMTVGSSVSSGGTGGEATSGTFSVNVDVANSFSVWQDVGCNLCVLIGLSCSSGSKGAQIGGGVVQLCSDGKKFVAINRTTGHVIVTAEKVQLQRVDDYIESVKASLEKQVVLDVRIAEVELKDEFKLGVDWSKILNNVFRTHYPIAVGQVSTPSGEMQQVPGFFTFHLGPSPTARDPFELAISALQHYGKVHVLSAPRVAVVNNQGAVIKVGEDIRFVTDVSSETNTETNTIGCDVDTETFFVGVSLSLVPYINEEGVVTMFVHPNVTELKDVRTFTSECGDVPVEEPEFYVREMDTVVKVKDGDTLIIGGLIRTKGENASYETPLLGRLPGIGYLFSREERLKKRTELFIFITPHVIYNVAPKQAETVKTLTNNVEVVGQ